MGGVDEGRLNAHPSAQAGAGRSGRPIGDMSEANCREICEMVGVDEESLNRNQSSYAKASEDTPSSNRSPAGVSHPKLEERRVVGAAGIEPATPTMST